MAVNAEDEDRELLGAVARWGARAAGRAAGRGEL